MGSPEEKTVHCNLHGPSNPAYACSHSLTSLHDGRKRGLVFVRDEDGQYNGWCEECDKFLMNHGEEWNDETEAFAKIGLLCEFCFERLIEMNKTS
ncbi:hypothetical protein XMD517_002266 [Aliiroseovarius sp. xm-d-517]|nr:hypothetical protein [Aliiroseovarius sp. xm-d-517]NRP42652.1 hypothetical protein [Aliiroseovarius sp. xm-m-339-2]NRP63564.1 hypothetical protein [Aliiroseovarius sp. xm-a-151]